MKKNRIGILTSGGDCAGLNPAIKWVVKTALDDRLEHERGVQYEVWGIRDGWKGLLEAEPSGPKFQEWIMPLDQATVRTWDRYGGTNLGTSRTNPYEPGHDRSKKALANIGNLGFDVLVAIGGDDTISVAQKLSQAGANVIGIPKTIDRDLPMTEYSLGYETALNVIVEEIDRLRTTAGSHKRLFVVETMGRTAGWLALEGGESAGAFIILIPEYDFEIAKVNDLVLAGKKAGNRYDIIVAAEGAKPAGGSEITRGEGTDQFGHKTLGGIGEFLANQIAAGTKLETRSVVLSHLQRGGAPCAYDRRMGRYFGIAAVDLAVRGDFGRMVIFRNGRISSCPLDEMVGRLSLVDVKTQYDTERYNGRRSILRDCDEVVV